MGEVTKKVEKTFSLPNEIITVKFIERKVGMAAGDHITKDHVIYGGMLNKSTKRFQLPKSLRNKALINPFTKEEKKELESIMTGVDLSVYGKFWDDFYVTLRKGDNTFDLSNPTDYISYKVLKLLRDDIAPSWKERNDKQTYQFVITAENEELRADKKKLDDKKKAFKLYGKIEDDKDQLIGVLKLLNNKPVSENSKLEWLQVKIEGFVDKNATKFIEILEDPSFYTRIFLNKAVELSVVKRNGNLYSTVDGLNLCEEGEIASFNNAVNYLDNPKHQDVRSIIEAKMNNTK